MVDRPIFIVGSGRCGSTIFQRVLCEHSSLAWLPSIFDYYAGRPSINAWFMGAIDLPVIGKRLRKTKFFRPWEPYKLWNRCYPGFAEPPRDLRADDVTASVKTRFHKTGCALLTSKHNRLLVKFTGWPRAIFLNEIFPDARFIHIVRDGRAVVNSMLNVDWWSGWRGPENWGWGPLTDEQKAQLERYHGSFVALASIEWNILMDSYQAAQQQINPDRFLEIRYEDFCHDPVAILKHVTDFTDLPWYSDFENSIQNFRIRSENDKWKRSLLPYHHDIMNEIMRNHLERYDYL